MCSPPLIEIELTDLLKCGGAMGNPGTPRDDTPALQLHCLSETCGNHNNRADLDEPTYSSSSALNLRPMRASRVNQIL